MALGRDGGRKYVTGGRGAAVKKLARGEGEGERRRRRRIDGGGDDRAEGDAARVMRGVVGWIWRPGRAAAGETLFPCSFRPPPPLLCASRRGIFLFSPERQARHRERARSKSGGGAPATGSASTNHCCEKAASPLAVHGSDAILMLVPRRRYGRSPCAPAVRRADGSVWLPGCVNRVTLTQ